MATAAVLGLGRMGEPMAAALLAAGLDVAGFDPRPEAGEALAGLRRTRQAADALAGADYVLTVLPGTAELQSTLPALLDDVAPGAVWIDCTSTTPVVGRRLFDLADERGVPHLDCALGGGPDAAWNREMLLYVGGAVDTVEQSAPVLAALTASERVHHVGAAGAGILAKLLINVLWFGQAALIGETFLLARTHGIDPDRLAAVLPHTAAASAFVSDYLPRLAQHDLVPNFGLDRIVEELDGVEQLAVESGAPFGVAGAVAALHRQALAELGARDGELLAVAYLERLAGRAIFDDDGAR